METRANRIKKLKQELASFIEADFQIIAGNDLSWPQSVMAEFENGLRINFYLSEKSNRKTDKIILNIELSKMEFTTYSYSMRRWLEEYRPTIRWWRPGISDNDKLNMASYIYRYNQLYEKLLDGMSQINHIAGEIQNKHEALFNSMVAPVIERFFLFDTWYEISRYDENNWIIRREQASNASIVNMDTLLGNYFFRDKVNDYIDIWGCEVNKIIVQ